MRIILLTLIVIIVAACSGQAAKTVTGADVVAAFKAAGLEAENTTDMGPKDYGMAPYLCKGTRFVIPSLGKDSIGDKGGRIFVCDNPQDVQKLQDFYVKVGQASAAFYSHTFAKGNVLVQINGELDKAIADKYGAALP